ncbi:HEPN domain-containing protein [Candidatus Micrarchaeota archaeon]|nr:HEPN domain-containing protein [Candidatus Micrarchaeota archaeon]MBU2476534.1 HEPN domain-containing protein [Candidatus Micrarchaeota archaeon]
MRKEVFDWMNAAEDDLETARILFEKETYYACAFYCQQAAEKALKAVYIMQKKKSSELHNLISIARELNAPEEIISACKRLNPHYIQTRYPDAANAIPKDAYDEDIAEELLEKAKEVFTWSEKQTEK